jgi:quinol monooxygenase YgiN
MPLGARRLQPPSRRDNLTSVFVEALAFKVRYLSNCPRRKRSWTMNQQAMHQRTVSEAISGGGVLVVAQWEARDGEADRVAAILRDFLPEAQGEPGVKLFLISRGRDNPAQFLFYELFRDEAAIKAHQDSAHFKSYIAGQALALLAKRERAQYALM